MKRTGELLKQKRETSGLSLSEVALATKINPKILHAIEIGDEGNLPAKTFLKGFVRSYAVFLRMDADEVLAVFVEETGGTPPEQRVQHEAYRPAEPTAAPAPRRRVDEDGNSAAMRTAAVAIIVVLIGLIIGVRELIDKYQREREVPNEVKVIPLPVQAPEPPVSVPRANPATPPPSLVAPVPLPMAPVNAPPAVDSKAESKKAVSAKPAEVKPTEDTVVLENSDNKPETTPEKPKGKRTEIIVEALDNVELKFSLHGDAKSLSLGPNEVHTILADEPMSLEVSDGGAVNLIVNGKETGQPGQLGKAKTIKIP